MIKNRRRIRAIAMAAVFAGGVQLPSAWAQGSLGEQILNGAIGVATKRLQQAVPGIGSGSTVTQPPQLQTVPSGPPTQANQPPPPWPTKAVFLEAARKGEFKGLPEIRYDVERQTAPLTNSVIRILRVEYKVPPLTGDDSISTCRGVASGEIRRLLTSITYLHMDGLSDKPPTFYRESNTAQTQENISIELRQLGTGGGRCTTKVLGVETPHPYGLAFVKLADEFSAATKAYVEEERGRRVTAYDLEQARMQAERQGKANAQAQRDADIRDAEQKRISSERARIEAEQIKRKQQEKNRVAG